MPKSPHPQVQEVIDKLDGLNLAYSLVVYHPSKDGEEIGAIEVNGKMKGEEATIAILSGLSLQVKHSFGDMYSITGPALEHAQMLKKLAHAQQGFTLLELLIIIIIIGILALGAYFLVSNVVGIGLLIFKLFILVAVLVAGFWFFLKKR